MSKIVAIVGRPNVGKSTFYNRLIGERQAIIDNVSGVTRDRIYGTCEWNGKSFTVVDTGGFVKNSSDVFESAIRSQVQIAIEEAAVIVFITDVTTGITDLDEEVANLLRRANTPIILCVNKVDNHTREISANEFWSLGFEETYFLSSISGSGTGEVLDAITEKLPENEEEEENLIPKFAIIGQPNVGKSSLTNSLLGEERNIVTDIAGTTRDSIHSHYNKFGKEFLLIDTAGIRKKAKVHEDLEFYSVMRAVGAIEESDVCILMVDAQTGIEAQDMNLLGLVHKRRKGLVIVVNKWDLIENKETNTAKEFTEKIKRKISPFKDVPILFVSVLEKQRIFKVVEAALEVNESRNQKIKTSVLNNLLLDEIDRNPPPANRGRIIKIKYVQQLPTKHPAFAFFCNHPKHIKANYKGFLENLMRKHFDFTGTPISIVFKEK
ncbi:ribosome biogenesis GTPase Der [Portibacter lacus]|uniref:GTPase Der n=1 Tax=Portibacter lacus TaxID=1099794 RepID=A0AA37SSW1_9BACT|nr:ribosome biogenesis GTPase Der [Portibacter lacus]GLR19462.1 GTPase Der [Portibacter lacus]